VQSRYANGHASQRYVRRRHVYGLLHARLRAYLRSQLGNGMARHTTYQWAVGKCGAFAWTLHDGAECPRILTRSRRLGTAKSTVWSCFIFLFFAALVRRRHPNPTLRHHRSTRHLFGPPHAGKQDRSWGRFLATFVASLGAKHLSVAPASLTAQDLFGQLRR
jgi:hypothetical protein